MKNIQNTKSPLGRIRISSLLLPIVAACLVQSANAQAIYEEDFEGMALGTLSADTHTGWTGMLPDNQTGSPITDWAIVDGGGLDWVAADGGTIDGGDRHFYMRAISNKTGRAFYDFAEALPSDIGAATSIYLRYTVSFDAFENISAPEEADLWTVWPLLRLNGSWQMRSILKFKHVDWSADKDTPRFFAELHNDKDAVAGINTVVFLEDKLGQPQPMTTYLVVTRYDFDDVGALVGQAMWVNPNFADADAPDLVSNHAEPYYDTFVNPITSLDITTYAGTIRFDNLKFDTSWDAVVPAASAGATWAGFPLDPNGIADTGDWMGFVYVTGDWVYSYDLGSWLYLPESLVGDSGSWAYAPK